MPKLSTVHAEKLTPVYGTNSSMFYRHWRGLHVHIQYFHRYLNRVYNHQRSTAYKRNGSYGPSGSNRERKRG